MKFNPYDFRVGICYDATRRCLYINVPFFVWTIKIKPSTLEF